MEYFLKQLIENWIIRPLQAVLDPTKILDHLAEISDPPSQKDPKAELKLEIVFERKIGSFKSRRFN